MNKRTIKGNVVPYESQDGRAFVQWCKYNKIPVIHIANEGKRSWAKGKDLKMQGLLAGVSDYFIPYPRGTCHGFWLELKRNLKTCKPTKAQLAFLEEMASYNYAVCWCRGVDMAIKVTRAYLNLGEFKVDPQVHS